MLTVRRNRYTGEITAGSRKRLSKCLTLMAQGNPAKMKYNPVNNRMMWHHLTFCTLTIPGKNISARQAYDTLLSHFLDWLTRTKEVKAYIWKAELQQRGQIHYHIVFPNVIHYKEIRDKWNSLLKKEGLLNEYAKQKGHFNAPSTDIRKVKHVKNIVSYLMKELGKSVNAVKVRITAEVDQDIADGKVMDSLRNEEIRDRLKNEMCIGGKVWDASENLCRGAYFTIPFTQRHLEILDKLALDKSIKVKDEDFWSLIVFNNKGPSDCLLDLIEKASLKDHLKTIFQ